MSQKGPITVSVTNGDATVTASGQDFLTSLAAGNTFTVVGSGVSYQIGSITNDNEFELTGNYAGSTNASASAVIQTSYTPNRSLPKLERGDIETATIFGRLATLLDSLVGSFSTVTATGTIISGSAEAGVVTPNIAAYGTAATYYVARDTTNNIEGFFGVASGVGAIFGSATNHDVVIRTNNTAAITINTTPFVTMAGGASVAGNFLPATDNTHNLGSASLGWKEVFADNGTINTSDARRKTAVAAMLPAELAAARDLAREIGSFQFLAAVAEKGEAARRHIGITVQRAIEIMTAHGLDPFAYSFICHDAWGDEFIEHPAIEAQPAREAVPAQEAVPAWTEQTRVAGDRYAFRVHELLLFIARGVEARLTATEERLTALESAAG